MSPACGGLLVSEGCCGQRLLGSALLAGALPAGASAGVCQEKTPAKGPDTWGGSGVGWGVIQRGITRGCQDPSYCWKMGR